MTLLDQIKVWVGAGFSSGFALRTADGDSTACSLDAGPDVDDVQAVVVRAARLEGRAQAVHNAAAHTVPVAKGSAS